VDDAMTADDVIQLYRDLESRGITICIDGGWAVDALLGRQTRPHADLDIALEERHVPPLRALLEARGYRDVQRDDSSRWNFVLGDEQGRQVDVHAFVLDGAGRVVDGIKYPAGSLTGTGTIAGHVVRCIEPSHLVAFHTGYPLRVTDWMDVTALCERFGIALPDEYRPRPADDPRS
jgi:lincosamide nucleotidyltransferase A/C/D/E